MLELIGVALGVIGAISTVWYFWEKIYPVRKLSWRAAEKAAEEMANQMVANNFSPTLIVGIGRGGAIMGALISGCLGHRSLLVIDRKYKWTEGGRKEDILFPIEIPERFLAAVLLVSGEVHSGNTMKFYIDYFGQIGAQAIRTATFYYEKGATISVDFKGLESEKKKIKMPWMFSDNYIRADRSPEPG
jgi:probable phosphoglycerate mutase